MTLDDTVLHAIDDVVRGFVASGRMFTAFDVSLAVKSRGITARHRHMRDTIHEAIDEHASDGADYTRTLRDVGAPTKAWVYHPWEDDPEQYRPVDRADQPSSPRQRTPAPTANIAPDDDADDEYDDGDQDDAVVGGHDSADLWGSTSDATATVDGAFVPDHMGQLTIPLHVLQSIGLRAGATVRVQFSPVHEEITLWRADNANSNSQATMQVDHDGSLRISEHDLGRAGLDACLCYRIVGRGEELSIRDLS